MQNSSTIQGVLSVAALFCLAAGWMNLFSPEINDLLYDKLFYILIGASFALMAQGYPNKNHRYISYTAAALCVVGALVPDQFAVIKSIGLFTGVLLPFFARPRIKRG